MGMRRGLGSTDLRVLVFLRCCLSASRKAEMARVFSPGRSLITAADAAAITAYSGASVSMRSRAASRFPASRSRHKSALFNADEAAWVDWADLAQ